MSIERASPGSEQFSARVAPNPAEHGNSQTYDRIRSHIVDARTAVDPISKVLNERGARYGDFSDHASVCQGLKDVLIKHPSSMYNALTSDKKQALDVICDKIARILTGDPDYDDNWIDIQGYAKLAQERLRKQGK